MTAPLLWWLLEPAQNPGSGRGLHSSPGHSAPTQQHAEGRGELLGYAAISGAGTATPTIFGTGTVVGVAANSGDGQSEVIDLIARQRQEDELLLLAAF